MPNLSDKIRKLFVGDPFGQVFPPRPAPPPPPLDGRTVALRILFDYFSELTFYRAGGPGKPPVPFTIRRKNMQIEGSEATSDLQFPALGIVAGVAEYVPIGLVAYVEEATRDVFGRGKVVQWQSEYTETFELEIHAASKAERRSIISGLEAALVPTEQWYGIRFRMPDYFDELVCFSLSGRTLDDSDSVRHRYRAKMKIEMRHNVVALVNYEELQPAVILDVTDPGVAPDTPADAAFDVDLPLDRY